MVGGLWVWLGKIKCGFFGAASEFANTSFNFAKRWRFIVRLSTTV